MNNKKLNLKRKEDTIEIHGLIDPSFQSIDFQKNYMKNHYTHLTKNHFQILLCHRPELIQEYKKYSFDLILSGHTHGGQIALPFFLQGLYAPGQGLFPKYTKGIFKHQDLHHIISSGLCRRKFLSRLGNPPELVVIKILSTKKRNTKSKVNRL